jgi:cysteinyl-tRNA synthetase
MDDDFDTPKAVAALFDLARAINREIGTHGGTPQVAAALAKLRELADVLGLDLSPKQAPGLGDGAPFIELLLEIRQELRAAKQWDLADKIRAGLTERGIAIEDTANGTTWRPA